MDASGSHEWNFECSEPPSSSGEPYNLADALRISTGVSTKVPQAFRNLACRIEFINQKEKLQKHRDLIHEKSNQKP